MVLVAGVGTNLMLMLYSHLLSRRTTGHYNLNMASTNTWKKVGGIVGIVIGGTIATEKSYEIAFPILATVPVFPELLAMVCRLLT